MKSYIFLLSTLLLLFFSDTAYCQKEEAKTFCPNLNVFIASFGTFTICNGHNVILYTNQGSGLTYQWFRNGKVLNGANSNVYYANTPGVYSVWVTKYDCINVSKEVTVTIGNYPTIQTSPATNQQILQYDSVRFSVTGGNSWQWYKNFIPIQGATQNMFYAKEQGYYHVEASNGGCTVASQQIEVNVTPRPELITSASGLQLGLIDTITLEVHEEGTYRWYRNNGIIENEEKSFLKVCTPGKYAVEVTIGNTTILSAEMEITEETIVLYNQKSSREYFTIKNNPFSDQTTIQFINGNQPQEILISDIQGKVIEVIQPENLIELHWGAQMPKGVYLMIIKTNGNYKTVRLFKE